MKLKGCIIILVFILAFTGCSINETEENETQPLEGDITIAENDKTCNLDSDCTVVSIKCGDCGGDTVNKLYIEKYKLMLEPKCIDHQIACDWDYRSKSEIKCINNKCRFVLK